MAPVLVALALLLPGAAAVGLRLWRVAVLCLALALTWPGAWLVRVGEDAYAAGLLTGPLWTPALLALCLPKRRFLPWLLAAGSVLAGWVRAVSYEPFLDVSCHRYCLHSPIAMSPDLRVAHAAHATSIVLGAAAWLTALRIGSGHRLGATVAAVSLVGGIPGIWGRPEDPADLVAAAQLAAAGGACALAGLLVFRRMDQLYRLVGVRDALTRGSGQGAAALLADALRDPRIAVGYPTDDGGIVDQHGTSLAPLEPGRRRTVLLDGEDVVAVVDLAEHVPEHLVRNRVGPAMLTALHNEGLERRLAHRVEALTESRRKLVEHMDSERSNLERDLHDGAQQEILALAMDWHAVHLQAVEADNHAAADVAAEAEQTTELLLNRLRDVARGIHPAILDGGGLGPALRHLADSTPEPFLLTVREYGSLPELTTRTAYVVARDATLERVDEIEVFRDGDLVLRVTTNAPLTETIEDRVTLAGGRWTATPNGWEVRLPCA